MLITNIISVLLLLIISFQDIKARAISWILLPSVFITLFIGQNIQTSVLFVFKDILLNIIILTVTLLGTYFYFRLRHKVMFKAFFDTYLGIGDIFFLFAITPYFNPFVYLVFLLVSQVLILLVYSGIYLLKKKVNTIPLAGIVSVFLSCLMLIDFFNPEFKMGVYGYFNF